MASLPVPDAPDQPIVVETPLRVVAAPERTARDQSPSLADLAQDRRELRATPGFYARSWRRFRQDPVSMAALGVLVLIVLFVLAAPLISRLTGFTPYENHLGDKLTPPLTNGYLLGSDGNGRDILTRLAYGGQVSLMIAVLSTFATMLIGGGIGLLSGYAGGLVDAALMRLVDVLLSIPGLPLLILIATLFAPGPAGLALVLAAVSWMGIARVVRGEVLRLRGVDYVEAARLVGAPPVRIALRHVLPNVAPILVVFASLAIPGLILTEAALSFLGIGVQVPTPSWGNMLGEAQRFFRTNASNILIPGTMIFVTSLALFLVGSGLRDAFDPRLGD
jgi:ABC-type dipeptide/oligopeptide/nickel transport system permease subunit